MIYLFSGDDVKLKSAELERLIKQEKGSEILRFGKSDFNRGQIEGLYSGSGLFSQKFIAVFSNFLEYEEIRDFMLEKLPLMAESENSFIFMEGKLGKPITDLFKKAGPKGIQISIFELPKSTERKFDNFTLANAFSQKDKLNSWIYFRQAVERGASLEELAGILFWKMKDMILKKSFVKFTEQELKTLSQKMSYLLPEARKTGRDAEIAFEQFLLEAF